MQRTVVFEHVIRAKDRFEKVAKDFAVCSMMLVKGMTTRTRRKRLAEAGGRLAL